MADALSADQIQNELKTLDGWSLADNKIKKKFCFRHYREAMSFIVRLSYEAEMANHHPELFNVYNTVIIQLSTHDAGGKVTKKDIDLARAIEKFNWIS